LESARQLYETDDCAPEQLDGAAVHVNDIVNWLDDADAGSRAANRCGRQIFECRFRP
jgi:hypothetical protein